MATANTVGQLFIDVLIRADPNAWSSEERKLAGRLRGLGSSVQKFSATIERQVTRAFKVATAAVAAFGVATTKVGADFEQEIARIGAITGAMPEDIARIEKQARLLGKTTLFTATQAAQGMTELAKAGLTVEQSIRVSTDAMLLAGSTGASMAQATGLIVSTMKQFGMEANEATRISDVFSKAMRTSMLDVHSLREAMKFAGTAGRAFNLTFEETTGVVAMLRNLGLEGSLAGTNLRMALTFAAKGSNNARVALEKYGLTLDDINPETNTFVEILEKVGGSAIKAKDAMAIFGARSGANIAAISRQVAEGEFDLRGYIELLEDSAGETQNVYDKMLDSLQSQSRITISALQDLMIEVFNLYAEPLRDIVERMPRILNMIVEEVSRRAGFIRDEAANLSEEILSWIDKNERAIVQGAADAVQAVMSFVRAVKDAMPIIVAFGKAVLLAFAVSKVVQFGAALNALLPAIRSFAVAAVAALGPVSIAIVALSAAIAAAMAAMKKWNAMQIAESEKVMDSAEVRVRRLTDEVRALQEEEKELASRQAEINQDLAEGNLHWNKSMVLKTELRQVTEDLNKANSDRIAKNKTLYAQLMTLHNAEEAKKKAAEEAAAVDKERNAEYAKHEEQLRKIREAMELLKEEMTEEGGDGEPAEFVANVAKEMEGLGRVIDTTSEKWHSYSADVAKMAAAVANNWEVTTASWTEIARGKISTFFNKWRDEIDAVKEKAGDIAEAIGNVFSKTATAVVGTFKAVQSIVSKSISMAAGAAGALDQILGFAGLSISDIASTASAGAQTDDDTGETSSTSSIMTDMMRGAVEMVRTFVREIPSVVQAFVDEFPSLVNALATSIGPIITAITNALPDIVLALISALPTVVNALARELPGLLTKIVKLLPKLVIAIVEQLPVLVQAIVDALPGLITKLLGALPEVIKVLADSIADIISAIIKALPDIVIAIVEAIPDIVVAIIDAIPVIVEALIVAIVVDLIPRLPEMANAVVKALVMSIVGATGSFVSTLWGYIVTGWTAFLGTAVGEWWTQLATGIKDFVTALWDRIVDGLKGFVDKLVDWLKDALFGRDKDKGGGSAMAGIPYIPKLTRMTLHPGEAVIPAERNPANPAASAAPGAGSASVGGGGSGAASGMAAVIPVAVMVEGRTVDQALVVAGRRGNAPGIKSQIQRKSGAKVGLSRGRYQNSSG